MLVINAKGGRVESPIDQDGNAVLHLKPGEYAVSTSLADACRPAQVVLVEGEDSTLRLSCVAP